MKIYEQFGKGMRLKVPFDGSPATFIDGMGLGRPESEPIPKHQVDQLLNKIGEVHRLDRETQDHRIGWEERGLPGDVAAIYCLTQ